MIKAIDVEVEAPKPQDNDRRAIKYLFDGGQNSKKTVLTNEVSPPIPIPTKNKQAATMY